ncbi:uncharacterized protein [Drosophila takahashii]|uniref:uncharacterized protein n=1 Tax=Drosophila takahashii TaxID=29030 RepID=UPI001CF8969E|nr:uncharacterized protein LOC108059050 [Drosophila takahashii]
MEKCRRGDLNSGPELKEEGVAVLGIGHWHVCRFMQHFSNYIRVGRHYNGNYTQEPQDMTVGGRPWSWQEGKLANRGCGPSSGLLAFRQSDIPASLSSSRGAAT